MEKNKLLVVYNTCGIKKDNADWYIECINSILDQDYEDHQVVLSSCLNSPECFRKVYNTFRDKISYCYHSEPHTVNITFNKTVQECVKHFGEFENYLYVDSGVLFNDRTAISKACELASSGDNSFVSIQVDNDMVASDVKFNDVTMKFESDGVQIRGEHMEVPLGTACNLHTQIFSNETYQKFNNKIIPDVFAAYCTESTFSFLCAAMEKKWVIMKDVSLRHEKGVDGASSCVPHWSPVHNNPWNNLLYGRDARIFINDPEAQRVGLGYEECNSIMMHNEEAYDKEGKAKHPEELTGMINKYFFLTKEELDYDKIKHKFIPQKGI